jgi:predicted amidohydrolase
MVTALCCQKNDPWGNLAAHEEVLREAAAAGCDIALFPEMSLSGSAEPASQPERLLPIGHDAVTALTALTQDYDVAAIFGLAERADDGRPHITQLYARDGQLVDAYRKRHLGEGEEAFVPGTESKVFHHDATTFGIGICAEAGVDFPWDEPAAAGAEVLFFPSAPGLYGPRRIEATDWVRGYDWWESSGLGDARRNASRTGTWIAMSTQAGATEDEDFPGIAALVDPSGVVVRRLPDWRAGVLVVDIPVG